MHALAQQHIVAAPVKVKSSQQQIIDQLHHQCQQNDAVIMLHGSDGSGKTTIAELFLEQASNYAECAFITVNERSTPDRLRAQILNQLFGTISLNDETLSRQIQRQAPLKHAVIVIDNGDMLAESFLAECVAAVTQLSTLGQKLSIIIAADSRWAYQQKPAPHLRLSGPTMIEVQPLNKEEQVRFVQALLPERQRRLWNLDRIQQFLSTINGYPGEIQQRLQLTLATQAQRYKDEPESQSTATHSQVEEDIVSLSNDETAKRGARIKLRYVIALATIMSLTIAGYLNREPLVGWYQSEFETVNTPPATTQQEPTTAVSPTEKVSNTAAELPSFEPLSQQSLELMPEDLAISYREALDDLNRVAAAENDPREVELGLIKQSDATPEASRSSTTPPPQQAGLTERAYQTNDVLAMPPSHYSLQIAVISSTQLLQEFRTDYGIADNTTVYQRSDGRFVITHGEFNSLAEARAAVTRLPAAIQQLEPWAKSVAAMQAEINASTEQ